MEEKLFEVILINQENAEENKIDAKEAGCDDSCWGLDFCSPDSCTDVCVLFDFSG